MKIYSVIVSVKNFYDQISDSDIKLYEEIRKLKTWEGGDYTTGIGCLLNYDYIENHYRLTVIVLSRQKQLDAESKPIQQIEFVRQLKKLDAYFNFADAGNNQSMLVLTNLEKINEINEILLRKSNSFKNLGKLSRNES